MEISTMSHGAPGSRYCYDSARTGNKRKTFAKELADHSIPFANLFKETNERQKSCNA